MPTGKRFESVPDGAVPAAILGQNRVVGRYCTPFGSPYGFGDSDDLAAFGGPGWYLHPYDVDSRDAEAFRRSWCDASGMASKRAARRA